MSEDKVRMEGFLPAVYDKDLATIEDRIFQEYEAQHGREIAFQVHTWEPDLYTLYVRNCVRDSTPDLFLNSIPEGYEEGFRLVSRLGQVSDLGFHIDNEIQRLGGKYSHIAVYLEPVKSLHRSYKIFINSDDP
jgi:hypothetical protein